MAFFRISEIIAIFNAFHATISSTYTIIKKQKYIYIDTRVVICTWIALIGKHVNFQIHSVLSLIVLSRYLVFFFHFVIVN